MSAVLVVRGGAEYGILPVSPFSVPYLALSLGFSHPLHGAGPCGHRADGQLVTVEILQCPAHPLELAALPVRASAPQVQAVVRSTVAFSVWKRTRASAGRTPKAGERCHTRLPLQARYCIRRLLSLTVWKLTRVSRDPLERLNVLTPSACRFPHTQRLRPYGPSSLSGA